MNQGDNSHPSSGGPAPNRSYVSNQSSVNNKPTTPQNKEDEFIIPTSVKKDKSKAKRSQIIKKIPKGEKLIDTSNFMDMTMT